MACLCVDVVVRIVVIRNVGRGGLVVGGGGRRGRVPSLVHRLVGQGVKGGIHLVFVLLEGVTHVQVFLVGDVVNRPLRVLEGQEEILHGDHRDFVLVVIQVRLL